MVVGVCIAALVAAGALTLVGRGPAPGPAPATRQPEVAEGGLAVDGWRTRETVRRVALAHADGITAEQIAADLNEDGVRGPVEPWTATAVAELTAELDRQRRGWFAGDPQFD